jgi:hypothetical protein
VVPVSDSSVRSVEIWCNPGLFKMVLDSFVVSLIFVSITSFVVQVDMLEPLSETDLFT